MESLLGLLLVLAVLVGLRLLYERIWPAPTINQFVRQHLREDAFRRKIEFPAPIENQDLDSAVLTGKKMVEALDKFGVNVLQPRWSALTSDLGHIQISVAPEASVRRPNGPHLVRLERTYQIATPRFVILRETFTADHVLRQLPTLVNGAQQHIDAARPKLIGLTPPKLYLKLELGNVEFLLYMDVYVYTEVGIT